MTNSITVINLAYLQTWVGRVESDHQVIVERTVAQMAGTLGLDNPPADGDTLPLPWHWLFFTPTPHALTTGADGHPAKGGFLPPVPLPRRMWAGSQVRCHHPVVIGSRLTRRSCIEKVEAKSGRSGQLVFVTVSHRIMDEEQQLLITELQDLVYREAESKTTEQADTKGCTLEATAYQPPTTTLWRETVTPDPVLLFRYSALTFNGHRIHYDRDYAVNVESYPNLVVQGPLTASLLLNFLYRQLTPLDIKGFSFRGVKPLFVSAPFQLEGGRDKNQVHLWARTPANQLAMILDVELGHIDPDKSDTGNQKLAQPSTEENN